MPGEYVTWSSEDPGGPENCFQGSRGISFLDRKFPLRASLPGAGNVWLQSLWGSQSGRGGGQEHVTFITNAAAGSALGTGPRGPDGSCRRQSTCLTQSEMGLPAPWGNDVETPLGLSLALWCLFKMTPTLLAPIVFDSASQIRAPVWPTGLTSQKAGAVFSLSFNYLTTWSRKTMVGP